MAKIRYSRDYSIICPTWPRTLSFILAPSLLVIILLLTFSRDAPLTFGLKGITWLFSFLMNPDELAGIVRTSSTSAQITAWVLLFSYSLAVWWLLVFGLWEEEKQKRTESHHESARSLDTGFYDMSFSIQIVSSMTLWNAAQSLVTYMILAFVLAAVIALPTGVIILVVELLHVGLGRIAISWILSIECGLVSALLGVLAYRAHCSIYPEPELVTK